MNYLTETDQVIFLAGGVGLLVGGAINAQGLALDKWLKEEWQGWDSAISRTIVSAIVWALVLSALAFITILYEPAKPLPEISHAISKLGLWMAIAAPSATRLARWSTDKIGSMIKPKAQ